jgi:glycosyltransferase involved in cell wall biosynthesis
MRLALLTHKVDFQDGQGRVNYEIVRAALDRGLQVTVVAEFCSDEIAQHPCGRFVRMRERHIPTQLLRNLYFAQKSARWLRKHRAEFDVIQANGFVTWEPADVVAVHFVHEAWLKSASFPFTWRSLNPYAWYQRILALVNKHFERRAFESAKRLVAVSEATAKEVANLGIDTSKMQVIYNGVDANEFHPPSEADPPTRALFGLPENVPMLLFVGDIRTPRKNLESVLAALLAIPEAHIAVAGSAAGSPYPAQVRRMGLAQRVHFLGKISMIPQLMRSVDVFVIPSRYESFGMVVLEAMASGLPVILSSRVGAVELVRHACRVIEDPDDTSCLTTHISALLNSPETRASMGRVGRSLALNVQWSRTAAAYLALYENHFAAQSPSDRR